jgi:hypothetical protein
VKAPWRRERGWTIDNQGGSRAGEATSNGAGYGSRETKEKNEKNEGRDRRE